MSPSIIRLTKLLYLTPTGLTISVLQALQGFMQDKIIASHTCFDGHMDVNC